MRISRKIWLCVFIIVAAALVGVTHLYRSLKPASSELLTGHVELEREYFTAVDETGELVFTTGHMVVVGDEYIDEDNIKYVVVEVKDHTAVVETVGPMEKLSSSLNVSLLEAAGSGSGAVGIYHTHSSESYEPSDMTDSTPGKGGIVEVGTVLADKLNKVGIKAIHDTTSHDPNDARAYDRSRRTAMSLLKKEKPLALFDVHRDAGPAEPYLQEINGKEVAKCMIVIGRQNPKMESNLEFARQLKDEVDNNYPGLVKGIFMGNADFNQDLFDRALLLELGTEKTTKESAMRGADIIGGVMTGVLPSSGPDAAPQSRAAGKTIGWILGILVAGTFAYLWIATGSWEEMKAKILSWFGAGGIKIDDFDRVGDKSGGGSTGTDGESK